MNSSVNLAGDVAWKMWHHPVSLGFRSLFYLQTPGESSFKTVEDVPQIMNKAVPYFFVLIALEMIVNYIRWGGKLKEPRWNDSFSSMAAGLFSRLPMLLFGSIEMTAYIYLYHNYRLVTLRWDSAAVWWLTMLGVDLAWYWVHRMAHEINFMWAAHQVHHSSEDFNLTTALRQPVFQRYSTWMIYLPLAFFIPPSLFLVHLQFNLLYQFWIHTESIQKLPMPLEFILNTPSHHRVHHGRNRYCIDKNYAGVLIIWDRMFGTFAAEDPKDNISYGLVHPLKSWNPIYTQMCHWEYIIKTAWREKRFVDKVWRLLKGPGWNPGKPRLGEIKDIPDIHGPTEKYDVHISFWRTIYCTFHWLLAFGFHNVLAQNKATLSTFHIICAIVFLLWTLTNVGYLYESRWFARIMEFLRCVVYLTVDFVFCSSATCHWSLSIIRLLFVLSAVYWSLDCLRHVVIRRKKTV